MPFDESTSSEALIRLRLSESVAVKETMLQNEELVRAISQIAHALTEALGSDGKVLLCGNGGSAADAQHVAAELVGRFQSNRQPLPAISLVANTSTLTAIGNDFSFDDIFARQVSALGRPGDVLVGLSTSGLSENVFRALHAARELGLTTIAFTGADGGKLANLLALTLMYRNFAFALRLLSCHRTYHDQYVVVFEE